jgi:serine/threonine protein kinase/Tfp pilus assembly protein PilF
MILQPGSRPVPNHPDYVLVRKLGAGAFGEVWHAHGPGGLDVALKFIPLDAHAFALVELRSLEVMKGIRHPNLVSLFGAWYKDGWLILAMELCDRSLQDRLNEVVNQTRSGIPVEELLGYMRGAADGLDALNGKQVQHRDVKPANLLLSGSGAKVADFGLAKVLERTVASNSRAGTLAYTAPECFKGQLAQQSDQYSLAVTYYRLRTGHLLFEGDQAQVVYAHLAVEPDLSRLAPGERVVLKRALSKEPGKRWRNCRELVEELAALCLLHSPVDEGLRTLLDEGEELGYLTYRQVSDYLSARVFRIEPDGPVKILPDDAENQEQLCQLLVVLDEYGIELIDETETGPCLDPDDARFYYDRGNAWLEKEEYDRAIRDFDEAIQLDPNNAPAHQMRGRAWRFKKDYDEAVEDFNEAIRLRPNLADAYYDRGMAWFMKKDDGRAVKDFGEAIRLGVGSFNASAYQYRGWAWSRIGEYDKAIADYGEAIRLRPETVFFYRLRGDAWMAKRDYDQAIRDYTEAIRLDPSDADAYGRRGDAWMAKRDYNRAIRDYDQAIRINPKCHPAYINRGYAVLAATEPKPKKPLMSIRCT